MLKSVPAELLTLAKRLRTTQKAIDKNWRDKLQSTHRMDYYTATDHGSVVKTAQTLEPHVVWTRVLTLCVTPEAFNLCFNFSINREY